jgi:hypothetical protein
MRKGDRRSAVTDFQNPSLESGRVPPRKKPFAGLAVFHQARPWSHDSAALHAISNDRREGSISEASRRLAKHFADGSFRNLKGSYTLDQISRVAINNCLPHG